MPKTPAIEFILPHEAEKFDGAFVGGGVVRKQGGRVIYRVTLRAGQPPQCSINGEPYADTAGKIDKVMWNLLVAVRQRFNA